MHLNLVVLLFCLTFLSYQVEGFTVGSKPYAYAECKDDSLECSLYGKIDLNNHMAQMIGHYRNMGRLEHTTIVFNQVPHEVPSDLTEYTTDKSKKPYLKFPHDVIKYGRNVVTMKISANTSIDTRALTSLPHLMYLEISNIQNISSHAVSKNSELISFKLSNVTLKEIPENMISMCDNVKNILIENARIDSFSSQAFYSLFNVDSLILRRLEVGMFHDGPLSGMLNLQNLEITNSKLTSVQQSWFQFLPKLTKLVLKENSLTAINKDTFGKLSNLKLLDLSYNQLTQVSEDAFVGLKRLKVLNLSHNKLTTLPVINYLSNLYVFDISQNDVTEASSSYFDGLQRLRKVDLTNNQISNFNISTLQTNYTLAVNVAFLSKSHYSLLKSFSDHRNVSLNKYTYKLNETLQGE